MPTPSPTPTPVTPVPTTPQPVTTVPPPTPVPTPAPTPALLMPVTPPTTTTPLTPSPVETPWTIIFEDKFEDGLGNFNSGVQKRIVDDDENCFENSCVRIQKKQRVVTQYRPVSGLSDVSLAFIFRTTGVESGEKLYVDYRFNGESGFTNVADFELGEDFENDSFVGRFVFVPVIAGKSELRFRFRAENSANDDMIFINNVTMRGKPNL